VPICLEAQFDVIQKTELTIGPTAFAPVSRMKATMLGETFANLMATLITVLALVAVFYLFGEPRAKTHARLAVLPQIESPDDVEISAAKVSIQASTSAY
jgi:hypothetical protein